MNPCIAPAAPTRAMALALLVATPLLAGCAAAFVAPVVLAGGAITKVGADNARRDNPEPEVVEPVALVEDAGLASAVDTDAAPGTVFAGNLPPPDALAPVNPATSQSGLGEWQPFVDFALERSRAFGGEEPVASALLVADPPLLQPDLRPCEAEAPAVVVDLDPGKVPFRPDGSMQAPPGLGEALESLRAAGVVVMWLSDADANQVTEIGGLLRESGLDPWGRDPLLLARPDGDRKQLLRVEANKSACVIAIAGDRRADFDELFDYLRVPSSAAGLDAMLGHGWFVVPPPLAPAGN